MGRAVEFAGVHVIFADPEADAGGLETGLRQVSRRAVTGRQERHFQRRDFVADALLHRLDSADRAENGVLRLVGLGVENDERAITKQHGSIAAGKLALAQTAQADALPAAPSNVTSIGITLLTRNAHDHSLQSTKPSNTGLA